MRDTKINLILEDFKSPHEDVVMSALLRTEEFISSQLQPDPQKDILIDAVTAVLENASTRLTATAFWVLGKSNEQRVIEVMRRFVNGDEILQDESALWQFLVAYENFTSGQILPVDQRLFERVADLHKGNEKFERLLSRLA
jgi:hypothetical protein